MKKKSAFIISIFIVFWIFIFQNITFAQLEESSGFRISEIETDVNLDLAPLDLCLSYCFKINKKFGIGVSGEFGINFSNVVLMAGNRLGTEKTLFTHEEIDEYDSDRYKGIMAGSIFTRIFYDKKIPLELGLKSEYFFHGVVTPNEEDINTGFYTGPYVKAFIPSKFKTRGDEKKRRPAFGVEASYGTLNFQRYRAANELAVMISFWVRFDMDYNS